MNAAGTDPVEAMARRLRRAAEDAGWSADHADRLAATFRLAAEHRLRAGIDPEDERALHTARTALILLIDAGHDDPATVTAATLVETLHPRLALPDDRVPADLAPLVRAVPRPHQPDDRLLEELLAAEPPARLIALAERLDHARHFHLRDDEGLDEVRRVTCAVYCPVAEWVGGRLGRRFAWWCTRVAGLRSA